MSLWCHTSIVTGMCEWLLFIHFRKKLKIWDKNLKLNFFKSTSIKLFQIKNCRIISKHLINYKTPVFLIERETAHILPEWVAVGDELSFLRTLINPSSEGQWPNLLQTSSDRFISRTTFIKGYRTQFCWILIKCVCADRFLWYHFTMKRSKSVACVHFKTQRKV